ncbi:MAG: hypothetical protein MUF49_04855 [Oculatellaceae cyanobacterium Prado106]|jgi:hypothetical protein|nr:hypothetical protein [Oculatellaceae cyanobacterium Prado106]
MMNLIFSMGDRILAKLQKLQIQKLLLTLMLSVLLFSNYAVLGLHNGSDNRSANGSANESLNQFSRDLAHQGEESDRPKTMGEWQQEARELEGKPGEKLKRIGEESGEAFKEFGEQYVEGIQETAEEIREGVSGH